MTNEYKANLWNECLKNNIFTECRNEDVHKVQELFEQTIEENKDVNTNDFISILSVKIKQMSQLSYKDLIPSEKQPIIDFSDKIEEEPLKDIDKLIAEKQKERQNEEPINNQNISNQIISKQNIQQSIPQSIPQNGIKQINEEKYKEIEMVELKKMVQQQNIILEKILESQIKILRNLQKK